MEDILLDAEERMGKSLLSLKEEFNGVRTGRASASLFDRIKVDCYGSTTPLNQVATVSTPEARLVVIQPWDKSIIGDIEKALQKSELSLNPNNDGKVIRINIPPLTEDRRKELVRHVKNIAEQSRVAVRNIRRDSNDALKKLLKSGELTEDEEKHGTDEIQKLTDKTVREINDLLELKEKEILEI